jgi:hypothetical protein
MGVSGLLMSMGVCKGSVEGEMLANQREDVLS